MNVKIRKLSPDVPVPRYATALAAGFDLTAAEDVVIAPGETALVRTGLAFEIPPGYELQIRPRSGLSLKTRLRVANSPGTVDADYRGEVAVIVDNIHSGDYPDGAVHKYGFDVTGGRVRGLRFGSYIIRKGDRICQGVICPVERAEFTVVDELGETERGGAGFGSTGVKAEYYSTYHEEWRGVNV